MNERTGLVLLATLLGAVLSACTSSSTPTCDLSNPAKLANSTWPKFRANVENTGTVPSVALAAPLGNAVWEFPPPGQPPKGSFVASPVITNDGKRLYIGSNDGTIYALETADGSQVPFNLSTSQPINSTAVAALLAGTDAIFFGGGDGRLYAVDASAAPLTSYWPYVVNGFVSASPALSLLDGTVYVGTQAGLLVGVCPNGITRWSLPLSGTQSSAAMGPDANIYVGTDDRLLRSFTNTGALNWVFSTSAPVYASPVVEVSGAASTAIYVADRGGRVFKVDPRGQPVAAFNQFTQIGPISSSPALAGGRLYVGSDDGNLYAVDTTTGAKLWTVPFHTGGSIFSSPAVALGTAQPVIVVGSDDGNLYFVRDDGAAATLLAHFTVGSPVQSSPAIGADGTVYVGGMDGRVYAIQ